HLPPDADRAVREAPEVLQRKRRIAGTGRRNLGADERTAAAARGGALRVSAAVPDPTSARPGSGGTTARSPWASDRFAPRAGRAARNKPVGRRSGHAASNRLRVARLYAVPF